jgi:hypothetical protein
VTIGYNPTRTAARRPSLKTVMLPTPRSSSRPTTSPGRGRRRRHSASVRCDTGQWHTLRTTAEEHAVLRRCRMAVENPRIQSYERQRRPSPRVASFDLPDSGSRVVDLRKLVPACARDVRTDPPVRPAGPAKRMIKLRSRSNNLDPGKDPGSMGPRRVRAVARRTVPRDHPPGPGLRRCRESGAPVALAGRFRLRAERDPDGQLAGAGADHLEFGVVPGRGRGCHLGISHHISSYIFLPQNVTRGAEMPAPPTASSAARPPAAACRPRPRRSRRPARKLYRVGPNCGPTLGL